MRITPFPLFLPTPLESRFRSFSRGNVQRFDGGTCARKNRNDVTRGALGKSLVVRVKRNHKNGTGNPGAPGSQRCDGNLQRRSETRRRATANNAPNQSVSPAIHQSLQQTSFRFFRAHRRVSEHMPLTSRKRPESRWKRFKDRHGSSYFRLDP